MRAVLAFFCLAAVATPARADEKEWTLALQPAFALVKLDGRAAWGGGGGVDVAYGVTDSLALRLTGAATAHTLAEVREADGQLSAPGGTVTAYYAGAGVTYAVDILRLVPYFDLSLGLLGRIQPTAQGPKGSYDFGLELGLGVDYLISRHVAIGFVVRYHAYLTAIQDIPVYLYAGPRLAFHFGG